MEGGALAKTLFANEPTKPDFGYFLFSSYCLVDYKKLYLIYVVYVSSLNSDPNVNIGWSGMFFTHDLGEILGM